MTITGYQAKTLKKYIWIKCWYIFNELSSFLSSFACLLIGVNQEVEGTTLHKEKKNAKETIEATAQTKNISHSQEYKLYRNARVLLTFFK